MDRPEGRAQPLMPLDRAVEAALKVVRPTRVEERPIDSFGAFLSGNVQAPRDLPGCDNSAMDGYAVQAKDLAGATRGRPIPLRVTQAIYAGHLPTMEVGPGEAARIFTGACMPSGADTVVRQEATAARTADLVDVFAEVPVGANVRRRGEELRSGASVFGPGTRIDAAVSGVLGALGFDRVSTHASPRVALFTVGDELLPAGSPALPHQLHNSNLYLLTGLIREAGGVIVDHRLLADDPAALTKAIHETLNEADVIVTSGGASVGDRDLVKRTLRELGAEFVVDSVALKPGKPVAIATFRERIILVLPGNPGAATVAFDRLGRPLLLGMQGAFEVRRQTRVRLDSDRTKQPGLTYFLSARLLDENEEQWAVVPPQGAGQLVHNVAMDGWVVLPRGRGQFHRGEWIDLELTGGARFVPFDSRRGPPAVHSHRQAAAVSVIGHSGSGKTTLLERVLRELVRRELRVAVLKHSSDEHPLHKEGSDTARYQHAGATAVAFVTKRGTTLSRRTDPESIVEALRASADVVLVEGWKHGPLPKIEVRAPGGEPLAVEGVAATISPDEDAGRVADLILELLGLEHGAATR